LCPDWVLLEHLQAIDRGNTSNLHAMGLCAKDAQPKYFDHPRDTNVDIRGAAMVESLSS